MEKLLNWIHMVLWGDIPNDAKHFYDVDGDIIYDIVDNGFVILLESGEKFKVTLTKVE
jgi:hypothetical protein